MMNAHKLQNASLEALLATAWESLAEAVAERRSEFRKFALATTGSDGAPHVRMLVLRDADATAWRIGFQTDVRTAKLADLADRPMAEALFWSPSLQLQVRASGDTRTDGPETEVARAAYARIPEAGRVRYRILPAPGHALRSDKDAEFAARGEGDDLGGAHFAVVSLDVRRVDLLFLGTSHRRAVFERGPDGAASGRWIVP